MYCGALDESAMAEGDCASRQRLRPWLIAQINGGQIPGLCWMNGDQTKFRIPWKHAGKQDWNPSCSQIFTEWAKQTGSYREGIDKPEYVKWKTRLRCALNKAQDIEYLEHESQTQEDHPEPYRVYELKPRTNGKKKADNSKSANINNTHCQSIDEHYLPCNEAPVPKMVAELNDELGGRLPSDLTQLDSTELRQFADVQSVNVPSSASLASMFSVTMTPSYDASYDDKQPMSTSAVDVHQLVDSMSSITFEQTTLNSAAADCVITSQNNARSDVAVFEQVVQQHLGNPFPASNGHLRGQGQTQGQVMALSQTPMTLDSSAGASFPQPVPAFQPAPTNALYVETTAANCSDDSVEQYGCLGLQDMLISDDNM